jgi:hypothetical protein
MLKYIFKELELRELDPIWVGAEVHLDTPAGSFAIWQLGDTSLAVQMRTMPNAPQRCRDLAEVLAVLRLPRHDSSPTSKR